VRSRFVLLASSVLLIGVTLVIVAASAVGSNAARSIIGGWSGNVSSKPAAAAPSSGPAITTARTIRTLWHSNVFRVFDVGRNGISVGDSYVFGGPLFNRDDTERIGFLSGHCTVTNPKFHLLATCELTATPHAEGPSLAQGDQITIQGWNDDVPVESFKQSITGGTGIYQNVRGDVVVRAGNPFKVIFDLVP
jgi:hypothetical protein